MLMLVIRDAHAYTSTCSVHAHRVKMMMGPQDYYGMHVFTN